MIWGWGGDLINPFSALSWPPPFLSVSAVFPREHFLRTLFKTRLVFQGRRNVSVRLIIQKNNNNCNIPVRAVIFFRLAKVVHYGLGQRTHHNPSSGQHQAHIVPMRSATSQATVRSSGKALVLRTNVANQWPNSCLFCTFAP